VPRIAILPLEVQGQIAAGEVVERPASVVKELAENALDAGARTIEVRLVGGGIDAITVVDDGAGMSADDAVLAFARHATSKLAGIDDLAGVATLGFRGEALPSIAAAGRVRMITRRAADGAARAIDADGTGARAAGPAAGAPGTTVEVTDLFAMTPARRKFLRTTPTEVGHVVDVLTRLAIATPAVGFRLLSDGRELFAYPPVRDLRQRVAQVLGVERARAFVEVEQEIGPLSVAGLLGPPRESIASARLLWTFAGFRTSTPGAMRWVRDRVLTHAVLDGYESFVVKGRYPAVVLAVRVAPGEMDVNVHPAKLEVRFQRSSAVHQLVAGAIRARLRSALGSPEPTSSTIGGAPREAPADASLAREIAVGYGAASDVGGSRCDAGEAPPRRPLGEAGGAEQTSLWQPAATGFRPLRFVGQLFDGYLLCERDGNALLIDQHAAHERVLYERLQASHEARGVESDALLVPETIALSPTESATLAEHAPLLRAAGLDGEPFGDGTYLLRTMPRLLRDHDAGGLVRALASELAATGASDAARRAVDGVLATLACHAAVRVGQRLERTQVDALLASMDGVPVNAHCPHGRPVAVELRRSAVEALFQR
jgi:DNA mismatch repair protein MutL